MNTSILNSQPWRFIPGDQVYIRGWDSTTPAVITGQIKSQSTTLELSRGDRTSRTFPAYFVVGRDGHEWTVPQIHLSRTPIPVDA
jgi:protein involved in polysaccharide export with SLBB domain